VKSALVPHGRRDDEWLKINHTDYAQAIGRHELFAERRSAY
jgi:hypothetical protein